MGEAAPKLFVLVIILAESGAALSYAWQGQWKYAGMWACYALANLSITPWRR